MKADTHNAANNVAELIAQMPSGWIDRRSVFDSQRERLVDVGTALAEVEAGDGWDWGTLSIGWEDACGKLVDYFLGDGIRVAVNAANVRSVVLGGGK